VQVRQEDGTNVRHAVAVRVAQERDAIRGGHRASSLLLKIFEEESLYAFSVIRPFWSVRFRDEYVAIRKDVEPARMVESTGESAYSQSVGGRWRSVRRPARSSHDVYDGDERVLFGRQNGMNTHTSRNGEPSGRTARTG
jgi:hypothetical protein